MMLINCLKLNNHNIMLFVIVEIQKNQFK